MPAHFGLPVRKRARKRVFCSAVPADATAAPPRPGPGIARYMPASPHDSSSIDTTSWRFRSGSGPSSFVGFLPARLTSEPCDACHMKLMKSHGIVCSSSSNCRDTGRMNPSAAPWTIICKLRMPSESSKSIMVGFSLASDDRHAFERGEAARVAQPQLDGMVADVAVTAEDLHRVVGDFERHRRGVVLREVGFARRLLAAIELPGRFPDEQP